MSKISLYRALTLGFAVTLAAALPGFAQEATPAAPAADALNMGTAATPPAPLTKDTAQVGQNYTLASFDAWEQNCVKSAEGTDPCQMYQLLKDADGNPVAEFSMFPLPAGQKAAAGATIMVPLETLLTANLVIQVDGGTPKIYPFTFCAQPGCVARVGFTAEEVTQFKKGVKADMTIVPAVDPTKKVVLNISLKGFTAAMDAVTASLPK
jgi:invasion protein IalB